MLLEALLRGQAKPEEIAQFATGRAKKKIPEMMAALEGHQRSDHHRRMIRYSVAHRRFLEEQIAQLDQDIAASIQEAVWNRTGNCCKACLAYSRLALPPFWRKPEPT